MMNDYGITLRGQLRRFIGHPTDRWFVGEAEVFFDSREQALDTPINVELALSINNKNEVYTGVGYYVLT